ncbi:MAG: replication initiator protein A [Sulfuricella sp.]|nr:replication initiator protein A [Sulfuricella sp.]
MDNGNLEFLLQKIESAKSSYERKTKRLPQPQSSAPPPTPCVGKQLPLWPNFIRALPNALARSALFNISNKAGKRNYYQQEQIASVSGVTISYTGQDLRQRDEDVFLQLLHLAKNKPLGEWVDFTAYSLVKALGWSVNTRSYNDLRDILNRLSATNIIVMFKDDQNGYSGSLVRKFMWRTDAGEKLTKWRVYFEPEIIALFAPTGYTHIYWELRLSLPPLAKWLHSFYSTHEIPYDYKIDTLWKLCGSTSGLPQFRQVLVDALNLLKEKSFLVGWGLDKESGLVHVERADNHYPQLVEYS